MYRTFLIKEAMKSANQYGWTQPFINGALAGGAAGAAAGAWNGQDLKDVLRGAAYGAAGGGATGGLLGARAPGGGVLTGMGGGYLAGRYGVTKNQPAPAPEEPQQDKPEKKKETPKE